MNDTAAANKPGIPDKDSTPVRWERRHDGSTHAHFLHVRMQTAFQPIFALQNGRLRPVACEALLRVFSGETRIMPGSFFRALKGEQRDQVEAMARRLHLVNAPTLPQQLHNVFVNFDPSILKRTSELDQVMDELGHQVAASGLENHRIVCEITEQAIDDASVMKYFVYGLRARGYTIAVDDFGSDHSDHKRVAEVAPDIVKIDGRMVQHHLKELHGFERLRKTVAAFRKDGIKVVLEGIQNSWHIPLAINSGADYYQGFALAVPRLAPTRFDEWLAEGEMSARTG